MVGLTALWLPILLAAIVVFVASSIIHMVLRYHWKDYGAMPGEDKVLAALNAEGVGPGNYKFPHASSMAEMRDPEMMKKWERGPVGLMNVIPSGPPAMGKQLVLWFVYSLIVGFLTAYVTGRTVAAGTDYLHVFRIAGTVAFLAYAGAVPVESIWKGQTWSSTIKNMFDGLVYGLLTGGVFGWLWP